VPWRGVLSIRILGIALAKTRKRGSRGSGSVQENGPASQASEASLLKAESHRRSARIVILVIAAKLIVAMALAARAIVSMAAALLVSLTIVLRIGHRPVQNQATAANTASPSRAATFVGAVTCGGCHEPELKLWKGSHHQLAMQPANAAAVLVDFNDTAAKRCLDPRSAQ
jgi:hypothetical protein